MLETAKKSLSLLRIGWQVVNLKKITNPMEQLLARQALAKLFADSRGVAMKIGQLLATSNSSDPMGTLFDNVQPLPLATLGPYIEEAMQRPLDEIFSEFDEAAAAASLGQVHHARLREGAEVAVKVRYPGIADCVAAELRVAGLMPGVGPVKTWGFDLDAYKTVLKQNMDRELNYIDEANRQEFFRTNLKVSGLYIPRVWSHYCAQNILVQTWETGVPFSDTLRWPEYMQQKTGEILLSTLLQSLFVLGEVHADPHPGNMFFRYKNGTPEVVLLDFGCTVPVSEQARLALLKLIISLHDRTDIDPLRCFAAMGFSPEKLSYIARQLPLLAKILLRPFIDDTPFNLYYWRLSEDLTKLLSDKRWWFRAAGPANLLLLLRSFHGTVSALEKFGFYDSWWRILQNAVGPEIIEKARAFKLPSLALPETSMTTSGLAKDLRVKVLENNRQIVSVSMPAEAALDLEALIPPDVLAHLKSQRAIDLDAVNLQLRESGLQPQVIFNTHLGSKEYRVWLE